MSYALRPRRSPKPRRSPMLRRTSHVWSRLGAVAAVAVLAAACGNSGTTPSPTAGVAGVTASGSSSPSMPASSAPAKAGANLATGIPAFKHVYLMVVENKDYSSLIGPSSLQYIQTLTAKYGVATNYHAITHPSQPNYVALFSGSTQGVSDDGHYDLAGQNLVDQLESKGKTWAVFAQGFPGNCDLKSSGPSVTDGPGQPGEYVRKHNPAISFTDVSGNSARCGHITDLSHFDPAAADFEMIVPNMCNDMHNCSTAVGDAFLAAFVPSIVNSPAFADSVLFITTDEGKGDSGPDGGQVATIVASPLVKAGFQSSVAHTHYSLLRTIEDAWDLGCLEESCQATNMAEFFKSRSARGQCRRRRRRLAGRARPAAPRVGVAPVIVQTA